MNSRSMLTRVRELTELRLFRFLILGAVNTALSVILLWLFVARFGWPYLIAQGAVHLLVVSWAFFPSRSWVFRNDSPVLRGILKFHIGYLNQLPIAAAVLAFSIELLGTSIAIGQLFAITVAAVTNYMTQRFFVFRQSGDKRDG